MESSGGSSVCKALQTAGWNRTEDGAMTTYMVPQTLGYGFMQLFRPNESMALLRADLFLYAPFTVSSLDLFPDSDRPFCFSLEVDKDAEVSCLMPTSSSSDRSFTFSSGRTVRFVKMSYTEKQFRSYLSKRYSDDSVQIVHALEGLPTQIATEYVLDLFKKVGKDKGKGLSASRLLLDSLDRFLFYLTNNTHELCASCTNCSRYHSQDRMGLCSVATYFLKYPDQSLSVEKLAHLAGMSPTKLKTLFKDVYGDTLYGYLRKVRMNLAASYLKEGRSVTDVAFAVGYKSVNRFSETFREVFDTYPSKVKRSNLSDD
ncbi:helix-turn-helix transcriptional regulator [uncultured Sphaerochaeta sp.]|uniref:helix-turn-helix transcriptional regulator n=1 Tax=uncultured Sphaerochaeta sp. TaxID=886478 RepID=UPI002A0A67DB|nr:helix-turn-helix transcriptional regulator [uncultured Sphaerochaeta sp.]